MDSFTSVFKETDHSYLVLRILRIIQNNTSEACGEGYYEIAQMLLNYGAAVDKRAMEGATALMEAAKNGHHEICDLLLERMRSKYDENSIPFFLYRHRSPIGTVVQF